MENNMHLTAREREIIRLAGQGLTQFQIARRLFISPHTVNQHLRNARERAGCNSTLQLAIKTLTEQ